VFLGLDDETGWPHEGVIDYVDNTVDASTGTIQLRGSFPNPTGKLFPGLFARIRVPVGEIEDAVLVNEDAIGTDLGGKFVLVVGADDMVELRHVELGPLQQDGTRVILSGLEASERYIVNGLQRARPGLPVTPTAGS
jgi:RND family efflux transporter MFP subunit